MNNWFAKFFLVTIYAMCSTALLANNFYAKTSERLESIHQLISELHPKMTLRDGLAKGDLDGDGITDVAYLVHSAEGNDVVLGVLRGQKSGRFVVWEVSKPFTNANHGFDLSVEKQSIFIHGFNGSAFRGYETHWTDQFKFRNGKFVIIGSETSDFAFAPTKDDSFIAQDGSRESINYLTRKVITTTIKNKKKSVQTTFLPESTKLTRLRDYGIK